eukprot:350015-Chlamydomonas_euryale.AAC.10
MYTTSVRPCSELSTVAVPLAPALALALPPRGPADSPACQCDQREAVSFFPPCNAISSAGDAPPQPPLRGPAVGQQPNRPSTPSCPDTVGDPANAEARRTASAAAARAMPPVAHKLAPALAAHAQCWLRSDARIARCSLSGWVWLRRSIQARPRSSAAIGQP